MLTCFPQSLCSWNFRVTGAAAGPAELFFNWFSEQGEIRLGGHHFQIRKNGPLSGQWSLTHHGRTVAEAHKPSAFFRSFELNSETLRWTLHATSALTRGFELSREGHPLGVIRPAHPFTRRAIIDCQTELPEILQLFSFWLVVITWRRAANHNASSA